MAQATVTGNIKKPDGTAWADAFVKFELTAVGADVGQSTYPAHAVGDTTDPSGNFSVSLWVDGDSDTTVYYRVHLPGGAKHLVSIPTATDVITLTDLLATYQVEPTAPSPADSFYTKAQIDALIGIRNQYGTITSLIGGTGSDLDSYGDDTGTVADNTLYMFYNSDSDAPEIWRYTDGALGADDVDAGLVKPDGSTTKHWSQVL